MNDKYSKKLSSCFWFHEKSKEDTKTDFRKFWFAQIVQLFSRGNSPSKNIQNSDAGWKALIIEVPQFNHLVGILGKKQ